MPLSPSHLPTPLPSAPYRIPPERPPWEMTTRLTAPTFLIDHCNPHRNLPNPNTSHQPYTPAPQTPSLPPAPLHLPAVQAPQEPPSYTYPPDPRYPDPRDRPAQYLMTPPLPERPYEQPYYQSAYVAPPPQSRDPYRETYRDPYREVYGSPRPPSPGPGRWNEVTERTWVEEVPGTGERRVVVVQEGGRGEQRAMVYAVVPTSDGNVQYHQVVQ